MDNLNYLGEQPRASRVYIAEAGYNQTLGPVIEEILETFPRDWQGKRVLVKPNMLAPHHPDRAVTTHPRVVSQVVQSLQKRGAKVMVGDNPGVGGYGRSLKSAQQCGVLQAASGCYVCLGENPVQCSVDSEFLHKVAISREVLEADEIVNLPKLKTHALTFLTASVKNTFGYVVGGDKMYIHSRCPNPKSFARALVDIYSLRPPSLTIMDAVVGMQGNGPSNGTPVQLGKILASDNAVSLDAVAVNFLGQKVSNVLHLDIAGKKGLGQTDLNHINILGDYEPVNGFRFPKTFVPGLTGIILNRYLSRWINCDPKIVHEYCKSCGLCTQHCPTGAMKMSSQGPRLNSKECIHCYCCQEMCPEDAVHLSGRLLNFLRCE